MDRVKNDLYCLIYILWHNPNSTHEYEHNLTPLLCASTRGGGVRH
jgi:hypothetical protein